MSHTEARRRARKRQRGSHIYTRRLPSGALGFYAYVVTDRGQRARRISLDTTDAREAERRFRAHLAEPDVPVGQAQAPEATLVDIAAAYLNAPHGWTRQTLRSMRDRVRAVGDWLHARGIVFASEITDEMVDAWIADRRSEVTHRTINRDLRAVRRMLAWANDRGWCARCGPILERRYLREARRQRRYVVPDPTEMARIIDRLPDGAREAVAAIYVTGVRIDELRRLTPWDVHRGALHVRPEAGAADEAEPTKGYRERTIPLHEDAEAWLRRFFAWTSGRARTFSESWLLKRLHAATDALGLPRTGLHHVRRAFATEAVRAGVAITVVSRWLGHADVRTTELYLAEYGSDARVVAPVPVGLPSAERVHNVSTTGAYPCPPEPIQMAPASTSPTSRNLADGTENRSELPMRFELTTCGLRNRPRPAVSQGKPAASAQRGDGRRRR